MIAKNLYLYLHSVLWTLILANLNTLFLSLKKKITYIVLFCCCFVPFWDLSHYKQVIVLIKTEDLTLLGGF